MVRLPRNNGAFFRSAQSRRELNYWLPGLNAGAGGNATTFTGKRFFVGATTGLNTYIYMYTVYYIHIQHLESNPKFGV